MLKITPVSLREREKLMDVLRGFSILGIFIANLHYLSLFNRHDTTGAYHYSYDAIVEYLQGVFIEGKFYSLFSLLFGWGISLQLQRGDISIDSTITVRRRLRGMLLFGMLHLLILWPGDIVAFYAMLGFVLLLFRNVPDRQLIRWGIILVLSPIVLYSLKMALPWLNAPAGLLFGTGEVVEKSLTSTSNVGPVSGLANTASWLLIWKHNLAGFFYRYGYLFFVSRIPKVLGMFFIGFMLGRNNNYKKILQNRKLLIGIIIFGIVVALPANFLLAHYMQFDDDYFNLKLNGLYQTIFYAIGVAPLSLAYAAAIALLYKTRAGYKVLSLLQPVGRMAFTNYITHSLIGILVFYGVGLAKGGQVGPAAWTIFAIAIFILQIFFSYIWLRFFNYGPIEWIWRSMTYKKWQPMRKKQPSIII